VPSYGPVHTHTISRTKRAVCKLMVFIICTIIEYLLFVSMVLFTDWDIKLLFTNMNRLNFKVMQYYVKIIYIILIYGSNRNYPHVLYLDINDLLPNF